MLTSKTLWGFPDPLTGQFISFLLPPPHPGLSVGIFTASLPPACSSFCTLFRDLRWSGAGWEVGRGAKRCVYRFLNVKYQLGVKSEPGDQLPGG